MKLGSTDITKIYLGSTEVSKAYLGSVQVYGGASPVLPYDARIEYLQGDGSAYIDTGVNATSDIRYECSFAISSTPSTNHAVFGARVGNNNKSSTLFYYYSGSRNFGWRYGNQEVTVNTNKRTGDFYVTNLSAARTMVIDGTNVTCNAATFTTNYSVYIFAMNNAGAASMNNSSSVIRIKSMKIYDGTTLIRDYIPVRVGSTGYLYDKVSSTLYGNANSSGAFVKGNDVTT